MAFCSRNFSFLQHFLPFKVLEKDNSVTIHHRNIQALATEIYKTLNNSNLIFMKKIFSLKTHNYSIRMQNLNYPNPHTLSYRVESFGKEFPKKFKNAMTNMVLKLMFQKIVKTSVNAIHVNCMFQTWGILPKNFPSTPNFIY